MRYRNRDPYWLTAKFASNCSKCKATIKRGARIFYYPSSKTVLCDHDDCGGAAERDFAAAMFDESAYNA